MANDQPCRNLHRLGDVYLLAVRHGARVFPKQCPPVAKICARGNEAVEDPYTRHFARQLHAAGLDGAESITIDSLTAQKRLIEAGFGIGALPVSSIEEERRLGTLRILDVPALASAIPIVRIHRSTSYLSHAARALSASLAGVWEYAVAFRLRVSQRADPSNTHSAIS